MAKGNLAVLKELLQGLHTEKLTTSEVAEFLGVDNRTVVRWCDAGKMACTKTDGGHRRIAWAEVERRLSGN